MPEHPPPAHQAAETIEPAEKDKIMLRRWLEAHNVNLSVLSNIFGRYLRKSGISAPPPELSLDKIVPGRGMSEVALSDQSTGEMKISMDHIETYMDTFETIVNAQEKWNEEEKMKAIRSFFHFVLIETLVHEYTHIHSKTAFASNDPKQYMEMWRGFRTVQVDDLHSEEPKIQELNAALNEAVTEKIAREIYPEYANAVGDARLARYGEELLSYVKKEVGTRAAYDNVVDTLEIVINHIANEEPKISADVVWGGIKREYMTRESSIEDFLLEVSTFMQQNWPEMRLAGVSAGAWNPQIVEQKLTEWEERKGSLKKIFGRWFTETETS